VSEQAGRNESIDGPRRVVGLFARHPEPGRVKTRLAASVGAEVAARLYAAFLRDVLAMVRRVPARRVLAWTPNTPAAAEFFRELAQPDCLCWPQPEGSLGARLHGFFASHLRGPDDEVLVVGSDAPSLPARLLEDAFAGLSAHDAVLGPALDGGYYLLALRGGALPHLPEVFREIEWSSSRVFSQTADRIRGAGLSLAVLPGWYDVDTLEDVRLLQSDLASRDHAGGGLQCPNTRQCLDLLDLPDVVHGC
jgi:hypothetical protein